MLAGETIRGKTKSNFDIVLKIIFIVTWIRRINQMSDVQRQFKARRKNTENPLINVTLCCLDLKNGRKLKFSLYSFMSNVQ